jgi:hypothetical protein
MKFSTRSKLSILLSLVTLVAVASAFMIGGFLRGSTTGVHAAAAASYPTSYAHLSYRGTASFKALPAASSHSVSATSTQNEIQQTPPDRSPQVSNGNAPTNTLPTTAPDPQPQDVVAVNHGFSGFNAISHADQRLASNGNQYSLEPPDQGLCAGNGEVLESVNDALAVYSEAPGHTILKPVTALSAFYGLPAIITRSNPPVFGPFISDPKCYYDRSTGHWFQTVLEIGVDPNTGAFVGQSSELIAVSQTTDAAGLWSVYSIDTTDDGTNNTPSHPGCPCFGDQPLIGADQQGFYVSTNEFSIAGPNFNGAQIYAISKRGIIAAAMSGGTFSMPTVTHIDASQALVPFGGLSYSVQPATSPDNGKEPNNGTEYFLSALDFLGTFDNRVAVWALTHTDALNRVIPTGLALQVTVISSETYGQPPNATQKTGPTPLGTSVGDPLELLASNDDRMNQVVYADGLLWSGVNTIVQHKTEAPRVGIAYFIVQPSFTGTTLGASMASQGYVSVEHNNVLFPSIGVTKEGQGVMSFSLSGPRYFPSAAYAYIDVTHGVSDIHIAGAGQLPEDGFSGYAAFGFAGVARWGDYSAAVADGGNIWIAAEYIPNLPRTALANWGTFISKVVA